MPNLSAIKIAIVDDEPSIITMLQMVLRREGFQQLYGASTCAEAISLVQRVVPDIVLLDIMLPDGSGLELCSASWSRYPKKPSTKTGSFAFSPSGTSLSRRKGCGCRWLVQKEK